MALLTPSPPGTDPEAFNDTSAVSPAGVPLPRGVRRGWRIAHHVDRRRLAFALAGVVAIAVLVVVVGQVAGPLPAPLHVTSGSAAVAADGHHVTVNAAVTNTTKSVQIGRVWWILSSPGQQPLWQHDVYRSADERLRLAPGATLQRVWHEDALIPPGTYTLSIWVHRSLANGTEVHSDEMQVIDLDIPVGEGATHLRRHAAPTDGIAIVSATATMHGGTDPSTLDGAATVVNTTGGGKQPQLRWELVGAANSQWWTAGSAAETSDGPLIVSPSSHAEDMVHRDLAPPLGRYLVRLSLLEQGRVVDQVLLDLVTPNLDRWDSSIARVSPPVGPVMVESIATEHTWTDGRTNSLAAVVLNRTDQAQVAQVGWVLGRPGDPTPWNHADAALDAPQDAALAPGASLDIPLPPQGAGAIVGPGEYQLSIWIHVSATSGRMVHSDAASAASSVTVPPWDPSLHRLSLPAGPVAVDAISRPARWADGDPVTVTLRNLSASPQDMRAWWVLGKVGDPQPFNDPVATLTPAPELVLGPGEVRQLPLDNATPVMPGTYALSIWVHVKDPTGTFDHSDGVFASKSMDVSFDPSLARTHLAKGPVSVDAISTASTWTPGEPTDVAVRLVNSSDQTQVVQLQWFLGTRGDPQPFAHAAASLRSPAVVSIGAHATATADLPDVALAMPGRYALSAWVNVLAGGWQNSDGVEAGAPVTVAPFDASVARSSLPAGPVMIEAVTAPGAWQQGVPVPLSIRVRNLTTAAQNVALSTNVARSARGGLVAPQVVSLGPGAEQTVAIAAAAVGPPGAGVLDVVANVGGAQSDAVQTAGAVSMASFDPSVVRTAVPTGALMVEAIGAPATWTSRQAVTVTVRVRNLTAGAQTAGATWSLTPPGGPAAGGGSSSTVTVAPWSTATITMTATFSGSPGTYTLAVSASSGAPGAPSSDAVSCSQSIQVS